MPIRQRRRKFHEKMPWEMDLHYEAGAKWLTGAGGGGTGAFSNWLAVAVSAGLFDEADSAPSRSLDCPVSCLLDSILLNASIS